MPGIDISKVDGWHTITDYQKLRNCIVHNEGRLEGARYAQHLEDYVLRKSSLGLKRGWGGKRVVVHKGFCEEVLKTVRSFFDQLFKALDLDSQNSSTV